jgi:hypothetical protein
MLPDPQTRYLVTSLPLISFSAYLNVLMLRPAGPTIFIILLQKHQFRVAFGQGY